MIRLLKLDDKVKNYLQQDAITIGHARALLALENNKTQIAACENIIIQDLTVRETEKYIDKLKNPFKNQKNKQKKEELEPIWQEAAAELEKKLKTKVKIKKRKKNNLIQIEIESIEKLNDLLEKL